MLVCSTADLACSNGKIFINACALQKTSMIQTYSRDQYCSLVLFTQRSTSQLGHRKRKNYYINTLRQNPQDRLFSKCLRLMFRNDYLKFILTTSIARFNILIKLQIYVVDFEMSVEFIWKMCFIENLIIIKNNVVF